MLQFPFCGIPTKQSISGALVAGHDQADEARQAERRACVLDDTERGLGGQAFAPARLVDQEGKLHFEPALDGPRQQPAAAQEGARRLLDRRPQPELGVPGVAVEEPLQFMPGFVERARAVREVAANLAIAVQRMERRQAAGTSRPRNSQRAAPSASRRRRSHGRCVAAAGHS